MGLAHSEFRAAVLAAASLGASLLSPFAFLAVGKSLGNRHFGTAIVALALGLASLTYAATCSLGFVAGSRDRGIAEHAAVIETRGDAADRYATAKAELATLKGSSPAIVERRSELSAIMEAASADKRAAGPGKAGQSVQAAASIAFVYRPAVADRRGGCRPVVDVDVLFSNARRP
jgi:hypothetical protein